MRSSSEPRRSSPLTASRFTSFCRAWRARLRIICKNESIPAPRGSSQGRTEVARLGTGGRVRRSREGLPGEGAAGWQRLVSGRGPQSRVVADHSLPAAAQNIGYNRTASDEEDGLEKNHARDRSCLAQYRNNEDIEF